MLRKGFEQEGEPVEFEPKLSKVPLRHETRPQQLGHVITMRNASKIILRFVSMGEQKAFFKYMVSRKTNPFLKS